MYIATKRPVWNKPKTYTNSGSSPADWSFSQWAWEFLRRNSEYQRDSEYVDPPKRLPFARRAHLLAQKWGLAELKPWYENYGHGVECSWRSVKPRHFQAVSQRRTINLHLAQGEVALVFDLNECMPNRAALDVQIDQARVWLSAWLAQHEKISERKAVQDSTQKEKLFAYLRILDAYAQKTPPSTKDLAQDLLVDAKDSDDIMALQKRISRMKIVAQEYVNVRYRSLPPKDVKYRPSAGAIK